MSYCRRTKYTSVIQPSDGPLNQIFAQYLSMLPYWSRLARERSSKAPTWLIEGVPYLKKGATKESQKSRTTTGPTRAGGAPG